MLGRKGLINFLSESLVFLVKIVEYAEFARYLERWSSISFTQIITHPGKCTSVLKNNIRTKKL